MRYAPTEYEIPLTPPAEVLEELDLAGRTLRQLDERGSDVRLRIDERTGALRIELVEDGESRPLTPSALLTLLATE